MHFKNKSVLYIKLKYCFSLNVGYLSPRSLKECDQLRSVTYYNLDMVEKGEILNGLVFETTEKTTDVLVAGIDTHFIKKQGMDCDYKWVPLKTKSSLESQMEPGKSNTLKADYHSLASLLKVPEEEYSSEKSPTDYIIKHWCHDNNKRITFGMLYTLLKHPGIIGNQQAACVLEKMLNRHGHQVNNNK